MIESRTRSLDARWGVPIAVIAALLLAVALAPSPASAAPASGQVSIAPRPGKAKTDLFDQGAKLRGNRAKGGKAVLRVTDLSFGKVTRAKVAGKIVFARGQKKVTVRSVVLNVKGKRATVKGKIGKGKRVLFRAQGKSESVANSVGLRNATLSLTAKGAKALAPRLGLDSVKPGRLGVLSLSAVQDDLPKEDLKAESPQQKPQPEKPTPPPPGPCDLPVTSEGSWTAPDPEPAPDLESPVGLTGGSIDWTFSIGLRGYVMSGGAVIPVPPATIPAPPMGAFDFPVTGGEVKLDASGDSADRAVIDGSGEVKLCHTEHKFSVMLSDPTLTLDGEDSHLTVDVETNMTGEHTPAQRVDLATLDMDGIVPGYNENTKTSAWSNVPVILTEAGSEALQLCNPENPGPCNYEAGDALDPISFEIKTDDDLAWPYTDGCDLSSSVATSSWPEMPAGPAPLPVLDEPEEIDEGSIDWGLRTSLRNTVNSSGVFNALGGASLSDPSDMSGTGKHFSWPASSGEYEPGDPGRLVLHGSGTVGLCNTSHGYGTVLSNPTLVIDGEDSRLSMDVASRLGTSWTRFGVDLATLGIGDVVVDTTPGPGAGEETVTWTFPDPGEDDTASGATETDSSVKLAAAGPSAFWLVQMRTAGASLNPVSVSIIRNVSP